MMSILFKEHPLVVNVELATRIGLNESIILQQVHYWLELNRKAKRNYKDGFYWTFNTFEEWQKQFPFWSLSTIKRTFGHLEGLGILVVGNYNKLKIDRTKWYRIDHEALETLINSPKCQNDTMDGSKWNDGKCQNDTTITRDYTETTTETNSNKGIFPSDKIRNSPLPFYNYRDNYDVDENDYDVVLYYMKAYGFFRRNDHPKLKPDQWHKVFEDIRYCQACEDKLEPDDLKLMIDKHFSTKYKNCDYNIIHFMSDVIKNNRYYEAVY